MNKQDLIHGKGITALMLALLATGLNTSCLRDMPDALPEHHTWDPEIAIPLGDKSFGLNVESGFDTALFRLDTISELPQWISNHTIVLEGDLDFDLSSFSDNLEDLNSALFRVTIRNGFPNEALAQAYFMDGSATVVDSMFNEGAATADPGTVVGNGETIDPFYIRQDASFEGDRLENLLNSTEIRLRLLFMKPEVDTALIPYYPGYHLDVDLGLMLDLTMEF